MALKIYLLSSEITPFAEQYRLAPFVNKVSTEMKEREHDIRLIMPKYGFISSRKYVLREVIRLRDIEARWKNEIITGNVRSAFVPETKVQVYFLELPNYFDDVSALLYKDENGDPLARNVDRFGLFSKISLRTLEKLFWQPDVIIANDWTSAFAVLLQKKLFIREEFFSEGKSVLLLHSLDEFMQFSADVLIDAEIDPDQIPMEVTENSRLVELAAAVADEVVLVNSYDNNMQKAVEEDNKLNDVLKKRSTEPKVLSIEGEDEPNWQEVTDQLEEILVKLT